MDINSYTGIPYHFTAYNCWGHVVKVRKDAGLETKLFTSESPTTLAIARAFKKGRADKNNGLTVVQYPKDYDIVIGTKKGILPHSGVYYAGYVSHCGAGRGAVCTSEYSEFVKDYGDIELWR